jgi:hypothetical protein
VIEVVGVFYQGPVQSGEVQIGTSVLEPLTWAMMFLGFAGLGFAGYRASRRPAEIAA